MEGAIGVWSACDCGRPPTGRRGIIGGKRAEASSASVDVGDATMSMATSTLNTRLVRLRSLECPWDPEPKEVLYGDVRTFSLGLLVRLGY